MLKPFCEFGVKNYNILSLTAPAFSFGFQSQCPHFKVCLAEYEIFAHCVCFVQCGDLISVMIILHNEFINPAGCGLLSV